MVSHAGQNAVDREIGEEWERRFEHMALSYGWPCHRPDPPETWWPHKGLLPDRVVSRPAATEWHELKHKRPTRNGEYGLEDYRIAAYVKLAEHTNDPVLYTIHDWELSGARSRDQEVANQLEDWRTIDILALAERGGRIDKSPTYYGGERATVAIHYWQADIWEPLAWRWGIDAEDKAEQREEREAAWALVKASRDLTGSGHGHSVGWARAVLGLDDGDPRDLPDERGPLGTDLTPPRRCPTCHEDHPVGTTCAGGWTLDDYLAGLEP